MILPENRDWIMHLYAGAPILRTFVQFLIAFCSRLEAASDIISGRLVKLAVLNKCEKFWDPRLNCAPEIRPEAIAGCIFDRLFKLP